METNPEDELNKQISKHDKEGKDKLSGEDEQDELNSSKDLDNFEEKLKKQKKKNKTSFDSSDDEANNQEKEPSNMTKKKSVTVVGSDNIVPTSKSQSKINESQKVLEGINEEVIEQENVNQDQQMDLYI